MSLALTSRLEILQDRAVMLAEARAFFAKRAVMEVDVPALSLLASVDTYIDLVTAECGGEPCFLHSSPEYGMKRLLAEGIGDIFQLSHVFREGEVGSRHNPEFTMVEWYRFGFTLEDLIEETVAFLQLFLPVERVERMTYRETFARYVGRMPETEAEEDELLAFSIEPHLGEKGFTIITDFPLSRAALAQVTLKNGEKVAERFEIFYRGMELANGYHELLDAGEQTRRQRRANEERGASGQKNLSYRH